MKNKFRHYHIKEELESIYKDAIIVLDTNSLLNIYRYNDENRKKYLEILKSVRNRIFLTFQIGNEFYKNRHKIIESRLSFKDNIYEMIEENQTKLIAILDNCSGGNEKYNSSLSILKYEEDLKKNIISSLNQSNKKIKKYLDEFNQHLSITYIQQEDPLLKELNDIIIDKVGDEFTKEELDKLYIEGKSRFEREIPPGYKDKDKSGDDKYNDFIIWKEIQKLAIKHKKDILFISDDRKEDWVLKSKGKDLGTRTDLIKEFLTNTDKVFYSVTTKRFIEVISEIHSISNTDLLIKETENIQKKILETENFISHSEYSDKYINHYKNFIEDINKEQLFNYYDNFIKLQKNIEFSDILNSNLFSTKKRETLWDDTKLKIIQEMLRKRRSTNELDDYKGTEENNELDDKDGDK